MTFNDLMINDTFRWRWDHQSPVLEKSSYNTYLIHGGGGRYTASEEEGLQTVFRLNQEQPSFDSDESRLAQLRLDRDDINLKITMLVKKLHPVEWIDRKQGEFFFFKNDSTGLCIRTDQNHYVYLDTGELVGIDNHYNNSVATILCDIHGKPI